jgi:hypothetical protein
MDETIPYRANGIKFLQSLYHLLQLVEENVFRNFIGTELRKIFKARPTRHHPETLHQVLIEGKLPCHGQL